MYNGHEVDISNKKNVIQLSYIVGLFCWVKILFWVGNSTLWFHCCGVKGLHSSTPLCFCNLVDLIFVFGAWRTKRTKDLAKRKELNHYLVYTR